MELSTRTPQRKKPTHSQHIMSEFSVLSRTRKCDSVSVVTYLTQQLRCQLIHYITIELFRVAYILVTRLL